MRVSGAWLHRPETQAVLACLANAGHRAYFVGGCVRNALLGEPVADTDIATDARPDEVTALARAAGLKPVPTGIDFGTITVVSGGIGHEVTTFRRDLETDGRHAVVAFCGSIEDDARRRDFTINALYADASGKVSDPLGGMADIERRRVRFIDDPNDRIHEDSLRILRFFRFFAWYGDQSAGLDRAGLAACTELAETLEGLSRERVGAEMQKLLAARAPTQSLAAMVAAGILARVLPGAGIAALGPVVDLEDKLRRRPDVALRLAALGGEDAAGRLRLSRKLARRVAMIHARAEATDSPAALGYLIGNKDAMAVMILRAALIGQELDAQVCAEVTRGAAATFPLRAADLMPALKGAELGRSLHELEARWLASGLRLTRAELLAMRGDAG